MSYEIYRYIFIGGLVLSGVFLLATIAIFFLLNIKNVIGDLTGSNAKRGIENIRNQGVKTSKNKKAENKHNEQRQSITTSTVETSKISPQDRFDSLEASETAILKATEPEISETSVLSPELLNAQEQPNEAEHTISAGIPVNPNFIIETDITFVHSSEVI